MKELERLIPDDPLDCLKVLKTSANTYCYFNNEQCEYNKGLADNIEKALKRLKAIDNANPSEALECLEKLDDIFYLVKKRKSPGGTNEEYEFYPSNTNEYEIIENYILKAQEQDKALSVIKKIVNETEDRLQDILCCKDYEEYKGLWYFEITLSEDEFNSIKEMFKRD